MPHASFIFLIRRIDETMARLEPVMEYVPAAVLAALVAPSFVVQDATVAETVVNERLLAGVGVFLVAWVSENMLASIAIGMAVFWMVRFLV